MCPSPRPSSSPRFPRARLADQAGFGVVEAMVSSLLVVLAALGLFVGLESADRTSGDNRLRTLASSLAQSDQERLRAFAAAELSNYRGSRQVVSAGEDFNVESRADWIADGSGTADCAATSPRAYYLKITSTITWPTMVVAPVKVSSLVAPPNGSFDEDQGSICVKVQDPSGQPLSGTPVSITGPGGSYGDTTGSSGGVFWGYQPTGTYQVTCGDSATVDSAGNSPASYTTGIVAQQVTTLICEIAPPGGIDVTFDTDSSVVAGRNEQAISPSRADQLRIQHSSLATPGWKRYGVVETYEAQYQVRGLFPFPSPYAVYAGNCSGNQPPSTPLPSQLQTVQVPANGGPVAIKIRQPALNALVYDEEDDEPIANARVRIFDKSALDCTAVRTFTTDSRGRVVRPGAAAGVIDNGLPYGVYDVCVEIRTGNGNGNGNGQYRSMTAAGVSNRALTGSRLVEFEMDDARPGRCP